MHNENEKTTERMSISTDVLSKVLGVLAGLPYQTVASVISEVQQDIKSVEVPK